MRELRVPISPGELLDKLTILRLKAARIGDAAKRANVQRELALLEQVWHEGAGGVDVSAEEQALARVNAALWETEDALRSLEAEQRFDAEFVALARSVYRQNDERAALKRRVNEKLGSALVEEKSYRADRAR
ncbi:MAG: hypothetical protein FJ091_08820 [Deltaproteobacteria bacterium]|nr:hypothetical protein [Deltaproteobacteria bacterium]